MTGIEGAAAAAIGKAVGDAGRDLAATNRDRRREENKALVEAAKDTDGFRTAAAIRGKKLAIREQWGLVLMRPLANLLGVSREYFETDFGKDFAEKIGNVPEENLQTPKAIIAGPVMEGLAYSLDEPPLKSMYLDLLAHASDDRTAESAHPSFVEVIRQLTSEEAELLRLFQWEPNQLTPIVRIRSNGGAEVGGTTLVDSILDFRADETPVTNPRLGAYLDNWVRLGLIEVEYSRRLTSAGRYDWARTRPEVVQAQSKIDALNAEGGATYSMEFEEGVLRVTHFGAMFALAAGVSRDGSL